MFMGITSAPIICQPDIVTQRGQKVGKGLVLMVQKPGEGTVQETMLKDYWVRSDRGVWKGVQETDSPKGEDIVIGSHGFMDLKGIVTMD